MNQFVKSAQQSLNIRACVLADEGTGCLARDLARLSDRNERRCVGVAADLASPSRVIHARLVA